MGSFPLLTVQHIGPEKGDLLVSGMFDRVPTEPLVPAFLFEVAPGVEPARNALEVLVWAWAAGSVWLFEPVGNAALLEVGRTYGYQGIWTPAAFEAVADLNTVWVECDYPDDGTHEHCLITFEEIAARGGNPRGFKSEVHGWLTQGAHREHVLLDKYGIRARIERGRVPGKC